MAQPDGIRIPQSGDTLILGDGRAFRLAAVEHGPRGWWFRATSRDDSCTLQGNLELVWDGLARGWRPAGTPTDGAPGIPLPPSLRSASTLKRKQVD
jgi:hypothetical protein